MRLLCKKGSNGLLYLRVGGVWILFGSRKMLRLEKCLKMPQNPTRQVHALLGSFDLKERWILLDNTFYIALFLAQKI